MAKPQGKKAAARVKAGVRKATARVKRAAVAVKKKVVAKKAPAKKVPSKKAPAKKTAAPARPLKKPPKPTPKSRKAAPKPAPRSRPAAMPKKAAVPAGTLKSVKGGKAQAAGRPAQVAKKKATSIVTRPVAKAAVAKPKAAAAPPAKPVAPLKPPAPAVRPVPVTREREKKRGRRARPRVHSSGTPVAAWLSTEKPRPASFIPAPPRAEAPSAIAAPPASSDRLIRPDDIAQPAVKTIPVRIDIEQGAGRLHMIANPIEVALRVGEGIEWDFRYIGGADVTVEDVSVEFERPAPFQHATFKTRKPGGARPHRQLSGAALSSAIGKRIRYKVRALTAFKAELASAEVWMSVTA